MAIPKLETCERVKRVLASKGLNLSQVSKQTEVLYGKSSLFFIPHNLYHEFSRGAFSPRLHQIFAFSTITGYRFHDWLRVFGFGPENITREQVLLPAKRTVLIDSALEDPEQRILWFACKTSSQAHRSIVPLAEMIGWGNARKLGFINQQDYEAVYAKVGDEDALAFPNLVPGSIVRANPRLTKSALDSHPRDREILFLVEYAAGVRCCRVERRGDNKIVLLSDQLPYAQVILRLPQEAMIHGVIDMEIRSLVSQKEPRVPANMAKLPNLSTSESQRANLGSLLRNARLKAGLSFFEASAMSRQVAQRLGDPQYFIAAASLSDYEVLTSPPRHIHKAITLCAIYGLRFANFLQTIGLVADAVANAPIPDSLLFRIVPVASPKSSSRDNSTGKLKLEELLRRFGDFPIFLRDSVSALSALTHPTLRDFFWIAERQNPSHPFLVDGILILVNRHVKRPVLSRLWPWWKQPLYVLLKSDGTYICACCSTEDGMLVIHPYSKKYGQSLHMHNHVDAEVIGEVVAVIRKLA